MVTGDNLNCLMCGSSVVNKNPMELEAHKMLKVAKAMEGIRSAAPTPRLLV